MKELKFYSYCPNCHFSETCYVQEDNIYICKNCNHSWMADYSCCDINDLKELGRFFPAPISTVIDQLVLEQTNNGIISSADKLCASVEVWFQTIGGLLLAEYLDAGAPQLDLNRRLFDLLENERKLSVGQWVAVASGCHKAILTVWNTAQKPAWPAFQVFDFGSADNLTHPVTRLVAFRNSFNHGSFIQDEAAILEHTQLLKEQVRILAGNFLERPVYFTLPDGGVGLLHNEQPEQRASKIPNLQSPSNLPPYTPFVLMPDGTHRMLAPALQVSEIEGRWSLIPGKLGARGGDVYWLCFQSALDRYRRERLGYVDFSSSQVPKSPHLEALRIIGMDYVFSSGGTLTLLEYRPGTGQVILAARIWRTLELYSSVTRVWRVIPEHPGVSGIVFARALLRWAELALGLPECNLEPSGMSLASALTRAGQLLIKEGKIVGVVLMDAVLGKDPATGETLSVVDVCKQVANATSGFRIVLLALPSPVPTLPYDGNVLQALLPEKDETDIDELGQFLDTWLCAHGEVGRAALDWLIEGCGLLPQFLSQATSAIAARIIEPQFPAVIEHALWTAAPFLERTRDEAGRFSWVLAGDPETFRTVFNQLLSRA